MAGNAENNVILATVLREQEDLVLPEAKVEAPGMLVPCGEREGNIPPFTVVA